MGWHWLIKLYRFQAYDSMTHHLYIALCAHYPKSNHLSLYTWEADQAFPGKSRSPLYPSGSALSGLLHPCCTQSQWVNKNHLQQDRDPPRRPEYYSPARPSTAGWTVKCHTVHSRSELENQAHFSKPFSKQPHQYLFLRLLPYCFLCLWGFVCLSYLFINYCQFFIPHRSEIIWFLTCFVLFHVVQLFSRFIRGSILSFLWLSSIPLYTPLLLGLKPQASMQASLWGKPSEESRDSGWLDRGLPGSQAHSLLCTVWHLTVQPAVLGLAGE